MSLFLSESALVMTSLPQTCLTGENEALTFSLLKVTSQMSDWGGLHLIREGQAAYLSKALPGCSCLVHEAPLVHVRRVFI